MGYIHDITTELIERHPDVLRQLCRWAGARVPGPDELRLSIAPSDNRLFKPDLYMLEWERVACRTTRGTRLLTIVGRAAVVERAEQLLDELRAPPIEP